MSIKERTERYTTRRGADLRGERELFLMDEGTETYIMKRMAELRGDRFVSKSIKDDPYIGRRIAYLREAAQ